MDEQITNKNTKSILDKSFKDYENDYIVQLANNKKYQDDRCLIELQLDNYDSAFSQFASKNNPILNNNIDNFLFENLKTIDKNELIAINIKTHDKFDNNRQYDIVKAIRFNYAKEINNIKYKINRYINNSLIYIFIGLIIVFCNWYFVSTNMHYILTTSLEITSWVFIWKAVEIYSMSLPKYYRLKYKYLQLYSSQITFSYNNKIYSKAY